MGKYLISGVEKGSGTDIELVIEADSLPNARAKGELKGIIVTHVLAIKQNKCDSDDADTMKKPGRFTAIGGMRIGSGICNILAGLVFCWLFLPLLLIPLGIIEIISGSNMLKESPVKPKELKTIAILEIVGIITMAGWIPLVVGILSLIWLSNEEVNRYIENLQTKTN